jgi:hypothetical protein
MAQFKTGKDQYVVVVDAKVTGDHVTGDLVILTPANGTTPASIAKAGTLAAATHMIALSDETLEGNYVRTDKKNYAPTGTVAASTAVKKVALYPLFDKADVIA